MLELKSDLICPKCKGKKFSVKRKATYVYTYKFDQSSLDNISKIENLPFLFDNREEEDSCEYVECENCRAKFRVSLDKYKNHINFTILQKAIRSDYQDKPEYLG